MANQIQGYILSISNIESMTAQNGNTFSKQSVFLDNGHYDQDTGEKYENKLVLDFINFKEGDIKTKFNVGDKVIIKFRVRGRQWTNKTTGKTEYGIGLSCYSIEAVPNAQPRQIAPAAAPQPQPAQAAQPAPFPPDVDAAGNPVNQQPAPGGNDKDLPF